MNERIKELMIEAFQSHYGDPVTPGAREKAVELVSGWGEKFAELIVRECARVVNKVYEDAEPVYGPYDCSIFARGIDVLKHFGVEE